MTQVRHAAVAGLFYPGTSRELDAVVRHYLDEASSRIAEEGVPKALIVPHAGYVYSGPIAASAYVCLEKLAGHARRVVLIGPCHRVPLRGLAVSGADVFETPLGNVLVDKETVADILSLPHVSVFDATHREEHSLEVHLPFLQEVLGEFRIVPLVAGDASAEEVAEVLDRLWGGSETLIVISSDLSHYLDYETARAIDSATCRAIENLDPRSIGYEHACGRVPVAGLLTVARRRGLKVKTLDLRNSGDTAGDRRRVVGYGAWIFTEQPAPKGRLDDEGHAEGNQENITAQTRALLERHGETLLQLAAASIDHGLRYGRAMSVDSAEYPEPLRQPGACFVTLKRDGQLRGCIGSPEAHRPLVEDVVENTFAAAFRDSRFPRLRPDERQHGLAISISVLSPPAPIVFRDERDLLDQLKPDVDGLIIESNGARALFLPQVWEALPEREAFLSQLKAKAGLSPTHWADDFRAWRFRAESVSSESLPSSATL